MDMKQYIFGVDVGGTSCKIGFFTAEGELLEKWEIPTNTKDKGAYILSDIADEINGKIKTSGIDEDDVFDVICPNCNKTFECGWSDFVIDNDRYYYRCNRCGTLIRHF